MFSGCIDNESDFIPDQTLEEPVYFQGIIHNDSTWSGEIIITGHVSVNEGVNLTIEPGTMVKFRHYRGYKELWRVIGLEVHGGTVWAVGTTDKPILFTSDADEPINGDWAGMLIFNSQGSIFKNVIIEFGQVGIAQFDSNVKVCNSIVRWCNSEGLYAERSSPVFEGNLLYSNAYHEIALEQYNKNVVIKDNVLRDGNGGVHCEMTEATISGNHFINYTDGGAVTAGMESKINVTGNLFTNVHKGAEVEYDGTVNANVVDNDNLGGTVNPPSLELPLLGPNELGYIPGSTEDRFLYVYDSQDESRRVIKRVGEGLYFGWALTYADNALWRFSLGSGTLGDQLDFISIDPVTGDVKRFRNDVIMNPRGLTFDGDYFYVNDFSLLKIFKFIINGSDLEIVDSFDIPKKEDGGTNGLTCDENYLYLMARDHERLYILDKDGSYLGDLDMPGAGGSVVWTGEYFWVANADRGLGRYNREGDLVGSIYPVALGTWAIDWDGEHLWTIQRSCELWDDAKIFEIEILDDSIS